MASGTLTATTAAASIGLVTAGQSVLVQADPDNTSNVKVGSSSSQEIELRPGAAVRLPVFNGELIHAKSVVGSQVVNWVTSPEPADLAFFPSTVTDPQPTVITATLGGLAAPTVAAAGNYAALDIVSNSASNGAGVAWVLPGMGRAAGGRGRIRTMMVTCSEVAVLSSFKMNLFTANPSASELDDNAAYSVNAADLAKQAGWVVGGALAGGRNFVSGLDIPYACAAAETDLYGILQTVEGETLETAGMTVIVAFGIDRYL